MDKKVREAFASYVRTVRKCLKLTQKEFALEINSTRENVAKYETANSMPPGDVLLRIHGKMKKVKLPDVS